VYPVAVDPKVVPGGVEWSMTANGSLVTGGLCLTAHAGSPMTLMPCASGSSDQLFTLERNGNLNLTSQAGRCVTLEHGCGPALILFPCNNGYSERFTLSNGQLCSHTQSYPSVEVCIGTDTRKPDGYCPGSNGQGFNCIANPEALARCRVHFTMWTIMKAPLLLGNDISKMDATALGVVSNKEAIAISQDSLGVQARRVSVNTTLGPLNPHNHAIVVIARCNPFRPTQVWAHVGEMLSTTDEGGVDWCVKDVDGTEEVGSWRAIRCSESNGSPIHPQQAAQIADPMAITLRTPLGGHLAWNNAFGASGPVPHTRYLSASRDSSPGAHWVRNAVGATTFHLHAADRIGIRDDDKVGGVTVGGDYCLDVVQDTDTEVWVGPLADSKWAVALLNRDPTTVATITVDFSSINATAGSSFAVRDIWEAKDVGVFKSSYTATVEPYAVAYVILTPA
jgi:hypothetical protein